MTNNLPTVPESTFTERYGVNLVGVLASQMGMVWREVSNTDLGIDGYLEVIVNGSPIGLIAVQIKSGSSHIKSSTRTSFIFRAEKKHVRYWLSYRLPVIVIVYDPEMKTAYWHHIQEYFKENDSVPGTKKVAIRFSKSNVFDTSSYEQLVGIAMHPDATAPALLALRASRYTYTHELLTSIELIELYAKRTWLGEWLPLDTGREQILLHSALRERGPAWFWFRNGTNRDYIAHLRSALQKPDGQLRSAAALLLAITTGRQAISDLATFIQIEENVFEIIKVMEAIPDLTFDDLVQLSEVSWIRFQTSRGDWERSTSLRFLSLMAKFGRSDAREQIIEVYGQFVTSVAPRLLHNAGYLWNSQELPNLREHLKGDDQTLRALAVAALIEIGEPQDLPDLLVYGNQPFLFRGKYDLCWFAENVARLFQRDDIDLLVSMLQKHTDLHVVAEQALSDLCQRLDEATLSQLLIHPTVFVRACAAEALAVNQQQEILLKYQADLSGLLTKCNDTLESGGDYEIASKSIFKLALALAASGQQAIITQLMQEETSIIREGIAQGLQYISLEQSQDFLFQLLHDKSNDYRGASLAAARSLAHIGDEKTLHRIVDWLQHNMHEPGSNVVLDVLRHLDQRLYCPVAKTLPWRSDFSLVRDSVSRNDYI